MWDFVYCVLFWEVNLGQHRAAQQVLGSCLLMQVIEDSLEENDTKM